jgi:hypothetical protein
MLGTRWLSRTVKNERVLGTRWLSRTVKNERVLELNVAPLKITRAAYKDGKARIEQNFTLDGNKKAAHWYKYMSNKETGRHTLV